MPNKDSATEPRKPPKDIFELDELFKPEVHEEEVESDAPLMNRPPFTFGPLIRAIVRDPVMKALREKQRLGLLAVTRALRLLVVETIAVWTVDHADFGRRLAHWLLRPAGTRPGRPDGYRLARDNTQALFDSAMAAVIPAKQSGSRRALMRYDHLDEEFERHGLALAPEVPRSSIHERLMEVARRGAQASAESIKSDDFLFDLSTSKYWRRNARGLWSGPYAESAMVQLLLSEGIGRKQHDAFRANVRQIVGEELIIDSDEEVVRRNGEKMRNTFVKTEVVPVQGPWRHIYLVLLNLVRGNTDHLNYLLDWLAAPLQSIWWKRKYLKMQTAIVLHGEEGAGKGTLEEILTLLYGAQFIVRMGQGQLDGKFHKQLENTLFVVANEVMSSTNRSAETQNLLKPWITDSWIPLEAKHKDATKVRNQFNIIFTANDEKPVILDRSDRRYTVFKTGPRLPKKLGAAVHADINGPRSEVAGFFWHLLHRKVSVGVGEVLHTDARDELKAATAHSDEKFAVALVALGWQGVSAPWVEVQRPKHQTDTTYADTVVQTNEGDAVTSARLNDVFHDYCRRHNIKPRSQAMLGKSIKDMVPEAVSKVKKVAGKAQQVWFGLPMEGAAVEADVIKLPASKDEATDDERNVDYRTGR